MVILHTMKFSSLSLIFFILNHPFSDMVYYCLFFFHFSKLLFSGFLQFKGYFVRCQNNCDRCQNVVIEPISRYYELEGKRQNNVKVSENGKNVPPNSSDPEKNRLKVLAFYLSKKKKKYAATNAHVFHGVKKGGGGGGGGML